MFSRKIVIGGIDDGGMFLYAITILSRHYNLSCLTSPKGRGAAG